MRWLLQRMPILRPSRESGRGAARLAVVRPTTPPTGRRPLRVGVQLPEVEREVRWTEYLALARQAEDLGFDSIWLGDHLLYRYPDGTTRGPWEAWTMLAALAAATSRIRLGPLVACTAF